MRLRTSLYLNVKTIVEYCIFSLQKKGGSDNASTDCEVTTFYFEIQEKHLPRAMDMFSQFFVSPLMMKEAMQREREAIESGVCFISFSYHFIVSKI